MKFNINLYACFIKRCCELTDELGKVGMIHPMTFMYIKTFEDVRKFILNQTHINLFVEYGLSNLFGSVMVDPAFYVLEKNKSEKNDSLFISLDQYTRTPQEKFKKQYCLEALSDIVAGNENKHVYLLPQDKLKAIKSWPFIYWISDEFREKFGSDDLETFAKNSQGMSVSNKEKYQRFYWEVSPKDICEIKGDGKRWVFFSKGGPFNKWYGNNWLVVDWGNDGYDLKHFPKAAIRNQAYYFIEGITYSSSGSKGTSFRYLPDNYLFSGGGPSITVKTSCSVSWKYICAVLNSNITNYMLGCLNPTVNTTQGDLNRIPFVIPEKEVEDVINKIVSSNINIKKHLCTYFCRRAELFSLTNHPSLIPRV